MKANIYIPNPIILATKGRANWPQDYISLKKGQKILEALDKLAEDLEKRAEVGYET